MPVIDMILFLDNSSASNMLNNNAQDAWAETDNPNVGGVYIIEDTAENQQFIQDLKVTTRPTLIFAEQRQQDNQLCTLVRIEGLANKSQITQTLLDAASGLYPCDTTLGSQGQDTIIPGDNPNGGLGLGLGLGNIGGLLLLALILWGANKIAKKKR